MQKNINKLMADRFFSSFWLFAPVLVAYYQANGLNASQVFAIQAFYSAALFVLEIPTGYFSDALGRRKALIFGALTIPISLLFYAYARSFWGFVLAEVILAVGLSMRSGTESAMLYDTLLVLNREKEHKKHEGSSLFLMNAGISTANMLGGLIASVSYTLVFLLNTLSSFVLLGLAFSMKEPPRRTGHIKTTRQHLRQLKRAIKFTLRHPTVRTAALYMATLASINILAYWSNYLYYSALGIPVTVFGFLAAAGSLISGFGGKCGPFFEKRIGTRATLALPLLIGVAYLLIGQTHSYFGVAFIFAVAFLWGLSLPILRDVIHKNTSSQIRATVLSATNMGGRLAYVILAFGFGTFVDAFSVNAGYTALGALFLLCGAYPAWKLGKS